MPFLYMLNRTIGPQRKPSKGAISGQELTSLEYAVCARVWYRAALPRIQPWFASIFIYSSTPLFLKKIINTLCHTMYVFKILPYFLVLVGAFDPSEEIIPSCNDSVKGDKDSNGISNNCINASINKDGWLYAECDVGSKTMSFGVGLNYCISNNGGNIAIQDE